MKKLLFLDFDGVLHPNFCTADDFFSCSSHLVSALDGFADDVGIIVSSSWRFQWPTEVLLRKMPGPLSKMVDGFTPEVEPGKHQRYREIRAYLRCHRIQPDWRALDDAANEFPSDCSQLLQCNGRKGLDEAIAAQVRRWLTD